MKVGCYQCVCTPGDFEANLGTVIRALGEAEREGVEILALPESLLTGYFQREEDARANSVRIDSPAIRQVLDATRRFDPAFMVGFNELRDDGIYNTVLVAERGELLGTYSKAFPVIPYFRPGRRFPVFRRKGVTYGVIICADGAYIEPARILALKGARIIFAPHYNFLAKEWVVAHYMMVRADHAARARENGVWFLRANNVAHSPRDEGLRTEGVGYGDSYLVDPLGQITAHAGLHCEGLMVGRLDLDRNFYRKAAEDSLASGRALLPALADALDEAEARGLPGTGIAPAADTGS